MSKEAMKLALEALENSVDLVSHEARNAEELYGKYPSRLARIQGLVAFEVAHEKAITALREALANEALDKMAENARELGLDYEPAQQEPVAWRNAAIRVGEDLCSVGPFGYYDMTAEQWLDWALSVVTVHAPPAQRKPLTLGQKQRLWSSVGDKPTLKDRVNAYGLAIEAAHGIKERNQ